MSGGDVTGLLSLAEMDEGRSGVVRRIDGGRRFVQRMAEMGIRAGTGLKVVRGRGPAIVELQGHRLVVGRGMVGRIWVEPSA